MSRTRLDMFAEVLETAKSGASRTRILTQANLDYKHATSSLDVLTDLGLLTRRQNSPISYHTTNKGLQFLDRYHQLQRLLSSSAVYVETP